jgi:hypothetical protein
VAREAYARLAPGLSESFDEFRHDEAQRICGVKISEAPASAFNALFAHFKALKGDTGVAYDYHAGPSTELRQHLHHISVAERAAGVTGGYTVGICRRMFRHDQPQSIREALAVLAALTKKAARAGKEQAA